MVLIPFRPWLFILFALAALNAVSLAGDAPADSVHPAVERGLQYLQKEAYRWKGSKGCGACHHAITMVWSFNEAKVRGYRVDEAALKEIAAWACATAEKNVASDEPPPRDGINLNAVYLPLCAETARDLLPPQTQMAMIRNIAHKQKADGSWGKPLDQREPLGGPPEDIAILSRIALLQSGDTSTTTTVCLKKAADWLAANHDEKSRQARNFRVLMSLAEEKPPEELNPVLSAIKADQNPDGGWSQTPDMTSDAYATGQTLYVLARAGVKPDDPAMTRGVAYLIRAQTADGSWPMISRAKSKDITPITTAGALWAVLGLLRGSAP